MTVHLPEDLEVSIREAVYGGRFTSVDDTITEAVRSIPGQSASLPGADREPAAPAVAIRLASRSGIGFGR